MLVEKRSQRIRLLRIVLLTFCFGNGSRLLMAQQNLFNVPSSEITIKGKGFFQQQINFEKSGIQSNTTFDFGLGRNWELGLNCLNAVWNPQTARIESNLNLNLGSLGPVFMINCQKGFQVSENMAIGIGVQGGGHFASLGSTFRKSALAYVNSNTSFFNEKLKFIGGFYGGNKEYFGRKTSYGLMAGFEFKLANRLNLMADFMTGENSLSGGVAGFVFYCKDWLPLSFGWQMPLPESLNQKAFVFELTIIPHKEHHK